MAGSHGRCPGDNGGDCWLCEDEAEQRAQPNEYTEAEYDRLEAGPWWNNVPDGYREPKDY